MDISELDSDFDVTPYILNEKNKLISKKVIHGFLKKYGVTYKIKDLNLFQVALTHTSYLKQDNIEDIQGSRNRYNFAKDLEVEPIKDHNKAIPLQTESYERLEFLGDSVIHLAITDYIFKRYPSQFEGFMTKLRTKLENGVQMSILNKAIGLYEYILISRRNEQNVGRENNYKILEDTFEAFIAALFLDSGYDYGICKTFIINLIEQEIDMAQLLHEETNYKDRLLRYHHTQKWPDPDYGMLEDKGVNNMFTMFVRDKNGKHGKPFAFGSGPSKKKGQQEAAKNALIKYGEIKAESDSDSDEEEVIDDDDEDNSVYSYCSTDSDD